MSAVRVLLLVVCLAWTGCASSWSSTRRTRREQPTPPPPAPVEPRCQAQQRILAPVTSHPRAAVILAAGEGVVVVWTERVGEHDALRLLAVDAHGAPRTPSVEVVDRAAAISGPEVAVTESGFVVSWSEPGARLQRTLDARGRPSSDVVESTTPLPTSTPAPCGRDGGHLSCSTPNGPLELPVDEEALSAAPSGPVVSLGASGLRLWLNECRPAP